MSRKKNGEIVKLTIELMGNENIQGVADIQSVLKEILKEGFDNPHYLKVNWKQN